MQQGGQRGNKMGEQSVRNNIQMLFADAKLHCAEELIDNAMQIVAAIGCMDPPVALPGVSYGLDDCEPADGYVLTLQWPALVCILSRGDGIQLITTPKWDASSDPSNNWNALLVYANITEATAKILSILSASQHME